MTEPTKVKVHICLNCPHSKKIRAADTLKNIEVLLCKVIYRINFVENICSTMHENSHSVLDMNEYFSVPTECPYLLEHIV